jgi:uncharacterized protein (DUF1499 family)
MSEAETQSKSRLSIGRILNIAVGVVVIGWIVLRIIFPDHPTILAGARPDNLGIDAAGQLAACPSTPNCINSQSQDPEHYIEPFGFESNSESVWQTLEEIVADFDGAEIIADTGTYLYAEFTTKLMGFVDDVEFVLDETDQKIDLRSASRLGESDLGTNRKRLEILRSQLNKQAESQRG